MERSDHETAGHRAGESATASGLHESADTARELARTLEHGADVLDTAGNKAAAISRRVDEIGDRVASARDTMLEQVRAHPLAAAAAAFAVGFLAGRASD